MAKKIIDVPDNADYITADEQIDAGGSFLLQKYNVADLPDAPEKRVIELPADSIAWLERMKSSIKTVDVYDLLDNVLDDTSWSYVSYLRNFNSETVALNTVAEWALGHVEFVPKNESKFRIRFFDVFSAGGNDLYLTPIGNNKFGMTIYTDLAGVYTEEVADKIIADVSNSNVYLTARKAEVEE